MGVVRFDTYIVPLGFWEGVLTSEIEPETGFN